MFVWLAAAAGLQVACLVLRGGKRRAKDEAEMVEQDEMAKTQHSKQHASRFLTDPGPDHASLVDAQCGLRIQVAIEVCRREQSARPCHGLVDREIWSTAVMQVALREVRITARSKCAHIGCSREVFEVEVRDWNMGLIGCPSLRQSFPEVFLKSIGNAKPSKKYIQSV